MRGAGCYLRTHLGLGKQNVFRGWVSTDEQVSSCVSVVILPSLWQTIGSGRGAGTVPPVYPKGDFFDNVG